MLGIKKNNMIRLTISLLLLSVICAITFPQSGQMGFSSVVTDKGSTGKITNATKNIIEDANQNWIKNCWVGYYIYITGGKGIGQVRKIISNTSKTLTVSPDFSIIPEINSTFVIRRGYKENTKELKLKLYMRFDNGNRTGGNISGYSCRIQASDLSAIQFVSVEKGNGLGNVWMPNYFVPDGKGQINFLVLPLSETQPLPSGLYNIATITYNILTTDSDKPVTLYITNCPDGGLPIGSTEDSKFFFFDTSSNESFAGREEILVLHNVSSDELFASNESQSSGYINSYPNPFNPTTTIKYELPEYSQVTLVIYDMLGRLISELVNNNQYEGIHSVSWEPTNVSSGTYFARLTVKGLVSNIKEVRTLKLAYTK